jgi:hypothetical protein
VASGVGRMCGVGAGDQDPDQMTETVEISDYDGSSGLYTVTWIRLGINVAGVPSLSGTVYPIGFQVVALIRGSRIEGVA